VKLRSEMKILTAYFLSLIRFQTKNEMKETAKETSPKVSSLGQGAK
jgi:hypothetical protein